MSSRTRDAVNEIENVCSLLTFSDKQGIVKNERSVKNGMERYPFLFPIVCKGNVLREFQKKAMTDSVNISLRECNELTGSPPTIQQSLKC